MARLCTRVEVRTTQTHFDHAIKTRSRGVKLTVNRYKVTCNRTGISLQRKDRKWWLNWDELIEAVKAAGHRY